MVKTEAQNPGVLSSIPGIGGVFGKITEIPFSTKKLISIDCCLETLFCSIKLVNFILLFRHLYHLIHWPLCVIMLLLDKKSFKLNWLQQTDCNISRQTNTVYLIVISGSSLRNFFVDRSYLYPALFPAFHPVRDLFSLSIPKYPDIYDFRLFPPLPLFFLQALFGCHLRPYIRFLVNKIVLMCCIVTSVLMLMVSRCRCWIWSVGY